MYIHSARLSNHQYPFKICFRYVLRGLLCLGKRALILIRIKAPALSGASFFGGRSASRCFSPARLQICHAEKFKPQTQRPGPNLAIKTKNQPTKRQTNKQASKHASTQVKQESLQTNKQTTKQTNIRLNKPASKHVGKQTNEEESINPTIRQTNPRTHKQASQQASKQARTHVRTQARKHASIQREIRGKNDALAQGCWTWFIEPNATPSRTPPNPKQGSN